VPEQRRLRWELQYLAFPYNEWTREVYAAEDRAQARFVRLSELNPPVANLSMRSRIVENEDEAG
jgi:hypothetical protein